ncbi:MAG: hypothetical protein U9N02_02495 [Campylobacterota bacterium]|nr:hypothetical protein [Campylobacterota bacterium]
MENILELINITGIALVTIIILLIATLYANKRVSSIYDSNHELVEKNNMALAFRRIGMLLGMSLALNGILVDMHSDLDSILNTLRDIALGSIFIFIAFKLSDKILINNVNNDQEIKNQNISVGVIEFGLMVSTGLIALGSFKGEGIWYSSVVYFILGQIILLLLVKGYSKYIIKVDSLSDNIAIATLVSSVMIALSLILMASIMGDFTNWTDDLISFAKWTSIGIVTLVFFSNKMIDKIFLPTSSIKQEILDHNYAAMAIVGSLKIGLAIVIVGFII